MKHFISITTALSLLFVALCFGKEGYKYQLALCAMFKDEARWLKEWIEFHKLMKVEKFYLYNNLSTDNYKEVLAPYIKAGEVELIDWPHYAKDWLNIQCASYNDALNRTRGFVKWVAFLDLDEFLFPTKAPHLVAFLKNYDEFGGVCANWQIYGTSGVYRILANQLMTERLVYKAPATIRRNFNVKSIVRPDRVTNCTCPHVFNYKQGFFHVLSDKSTFNSLIAPKVVLDELRINHYWCRDDEYYNNVKLPRRASLGWAGDIERLKEEAKQHNAIHDDAIYRFLPRLKRRMNLL